MRARKMKPFVTRVAIGFAALLTISAAPPVIAGDPAPAYEDIRETYGSVPGFFRLFPERDLDDLWHAFRVLQLNPWLGLDAKTRELIGMVVAGQRHCDTCFYFHVAAAAANGASEAEIIAAATLVAKTRRFHVAIERSGAHAASFARETDLVLWGDQQTADQRRPQLDLAGLQSASNAACD